MLCQGLVVVVQMSDRIYSVLIVLAIMDLHCGSWTPKESNNSTQHGESASEKYGMVHTEHIVDYCAICMKDRGRPFKTFHGILHQCHK